MIEFGKIRLSVIARRKMAASSAPDSSGADSTLEIAKVKFFLKVKCHTQTILPLLGSMQ